MYIYHALINALSAHTIHINLNTVFYTHGPTKTIYIKYYMETHTHTLLMRVLLMSPHLFFSVFALANDYCHPLMLPLIILYKHVCHHVFLLVDEPNLLVTFVCMFQLNGYICFAG